MVHVPKHLKSLDIISLITGEHVINIQRQHWIVLIVPMIFDILFVVVLFFVSLAVLQPQLPLFEYRLVVGYLVLFCLSFLFIVNTYIFMDWYYTFYIITTKRLIHARYFRLGGTYSEEVFLEGNTIRELDRTASNPIYDFFDIEDVAVYFKELEVHEPFVFKAPSDSRIVKHIIEELCTGKKK